MLHTIKHREMGTERGQRVTPIEKRLEAGFHKVSWNCRDYSGIKVSTGTYLMRIRMGGKIYKKMLTVMK